MRSYGQRSSETPLDTLLACAEGAEATAASHDERAQELEADAAKERDKAGAMRAAALQYRAALDALKASGYHEPAPLTIIRDDSPEHDDRTFFAPDSHLMVDP